MMRWLDVFRLRLQSLFRGSALDRDLDREIRSHIDQQIDEHVAAGMTPDAARRAAMREFGSVSGVAEACRDTRRVTPVHNLGRDVRYAVRGLWRQPGLPLVAAASIALGVGANLTVFSLGNSLLLSAPSAAEPDRLVHIRTRNGSHVPYGAWRELHASGALAGLAGYRIDPAVNWRGSDRSITVAALVVTANYFEVVGVPVARGRGFTAAEAAPERDPRLAVVSDGFWRRQLGADPQVVGRSLTLNGEPYAIVGVLGAGVRSLPGYGIAPEVYLPLSRALAPGLDTGRAPAVQLIGRLREGQSVATGRAAVAAAIQQIGQRRADPEFAVLTAFSTVGGLSQVKDFAEVGVFFAVLLVVTGLVLAIACANVTGLLLARAATRRREMAMRVALGASRGRLVQQLLTEGLVLGAVGTLAGLAITALLAIVLSRLSLPLPVPIDIAMAFDVRLAAVALGLVLLSTLLCALLPALHATRLSPAPALKQEEPKYVHRRVTLRGLLVMGQVAVTVLLLVAAVVFLRNLTMARSLDPGFDPDRVLVGQLTFVEGRQGELPAPAVDAVVDRLRAVPGVEAAAFTEAVPLTLFSGAHVGTEIAIDGGERPVHVEYQESRVGPEYFAAMGIPVLRGRDFGSGDRAGARPVAIVNREFAERHLGGRDPLGQHLAWQGSRAGPPVEIVGVVANGKYRSLGEEPTPAVYLPYLQGRDVERMVHVVVRSAAPPETLAAAVRDAVLEVDGSVALAVEPLTSALSFAFLPSRIGAALFGVMGLLGTALAMIGLYGVISFAVARRTPEIGIRMALGATRGAVLRMVLKESAVLVGVGLAVGLGLAVLLAGPLAAFVVPGLRPGDPVHLVGTALLIAAVSLAAAWSPARRAIHVQPAAALRND